jgi:hypothetical protein
VSFSAYLQHTETGLAIVFAGPVLPLDLTSDVAEHFASLIAIEARARVAGIVRALEAAPPLRPLVGVAHPLCCDRDNCDNCLNGDAHA